jgi:hypothetical protein
MSEVKVNKISPRTNCGTVQLGDSGDTITIPAGATITNSGTQTGFGRSGAVDWQTSIKTSDFTAVSGEGYFVDTSSGAVTVTLPASPSAGAIVSVKDYANSADTNAITLARNGSNIDGAAENVDMVVEGIAVTIVYADATKGWLVVESGQKDDLIAPAFITATGGTITTVCTNFKVHTFTGPGTFCVSCAGNPAGSNTVSYMVIAGGGGSTWDNGGGGGAGGYRESKASTDSYTASPLNATSGPTFNLPVSAQAYSIVVGGGGAGLAPPGPGPGGRGGDGGTSSFSTISSAGGGGGGLCSTFCAPAAGSGIGNPGGSGGGAGQVRNVPSAAGGTGNTPPVSPPQGNPGGTGANPPGGNNPMGGAGGGGATAAGTGMTHPTPNDGKAGGAGATSSITGSPVGRAGGGGGGVGQPGCGAGGTATDGGGAGGGAPGAGPGPAANAGTDGTDNTGGGAGGGGQGMDGSANGGSGIVVIRYKFQ